MFNSLRYFFVAILLVGGAKLIEVGFYDMLKTPSKKDKQYHGEEEEKKKEEDSMDEEAVNPFEAEASEEDTVTVESTEIETSNQLSAEESSESPVEQPVETSTDQAPSNDTQTASISSTDYFQELKNSYLSPILASLPEGRSREDVVVRYYRHEADGNKVYSLRSLGYYLHEREAEDNQDLASNSLYYGKDVDIRDIQVVAFALLDAGVPLKAIKESQYDWKYNSLKIGADSSVEGNAILSRADIIALSN